jgi:hypothetical protein
VVRTEYAISADPTRIRFTYEHVFVAASTHEHANCYLDQGPISRAQACCLVDAAGIVDANDQRYGAVVAYARASVSDD